MPQIIVDNVALLEERLLTPGKKPIGPVAIDWTHPLTRGLVGCWIIQDYGNASHNLVNDVIGANAFINFIKIEPNAEGEVGARVTNDNSNTRIHLAEIGPNDALSGYPSREISVYSYANQGHKDQSGNLYPRIIDFYYGDGWCFYFNMVTSQTKISFSIDNFAAVSQNIDFLDDTDTGYGASASDGSKGNDARFFVNGEYNSNQAMSGKLMGSATNGLSLLNRETITDRQNFAPVYCVHVWDRLLSDEEHAEIHADRYQFIVPV